MSSVILNQLQELRKPSGKYLDKVVVTYIQDHKRPLALVNREMMHNAKWAVRPRNGIAALAHRKNRQSIRKVKTLPLIGNSLVVTELNTALLGGTSYPVLSAVLGTAAGLASLGAGLLFAAVTTGLSLTQTSQRVLARAGDEIWHVEEIGKVGGIVTYVSSYILVDPYRYQTPHKGWLIHESRDEVLLN